MQAQQVLQKLPRVVRKLLGRDTPPAKPNQKIRDTILNKHYVKPYLQTVAEWMQYQQSEIVFDKVSWMGLKTVHNILDLWIYQEIIAERKPDLIIEIGSLHGGTTMFLANILDLLGHGQVLSVEIKRPKTFPVHPRIVTLDGSSADETLIKKAAEMAKGKKTMIIHDGDHHRDSVFRDLENFGPFVTKGQYYIVCDGVNDVFVPEVRLGKRYPGPLKATQAFVKTHPEFQIDMAREKYLITHNPHGFLERVS